MLRDLKKEIFYPYPPQRVWQGLTNRHALAAWLMENDFEARIGHKFQFLSSSLPGMDGSIDCEVIELEEPRRLTFTWQDKMMRQPSIVTWTLKAVDGGTQLRLEHKILEPAMIASREPVYSQGWQDETIRINPSSRLDRQFAVSTLTSFDSSSIIPKVRSPFEISSSLLLHSYLNGGWENKLNQNFLQLLSQS